uniref:Maelstrom spermatogenic transposon silencer n=1 Tax=Rousettus aegyptiacus TaxID=9407 RepID=A0A7J8BFM5_ROUAE|nr:maelstrom spermatogenic transposon silencer [Rousettus aegyptiacus]
MAKASEIRHDLELLTVEDLVVGIYQQRFLKEPSKTWVRSLLDVAMWDYSSNTRCKWHEENDILFCALAVCKKIAYCISNSLATHFGIQLTEAHVPLQDYEASSSVTPKMVVLDAGRYQKLRFESPGFSHFNSSNQEQRSNTPTGEHLVLHNARPSVWGPQGVALNSPLRTSFRVCGRRCLGTFIWH